MGGWRGERGGVKGGGLVKGKEGGVGFGKNYLFGKEEGEGLDKG